MNPQTFDSLGSSRITVIDSRNSLRIEKTIHTVSLIYKSRNGIGFLAGWQFPVPACKRRYVLGKRELAIEECGKVPNQILYQFSGTFVGEI